MSDDFDDLRSLFDDEEDEDAFPPPDETPGWDEGDVPRPDTGELSGRLGLTGALDWQKAGQSDMPESGSDDQPLDFDWLSDVPDAGESKPSSGGLGLTGQLDWQKVAGDAEIESGGDMPDWMSDLSPEQPPSGGSPSPIWGDAPPAASNQGVPDVPDWLLDDQSSAAPEDAIPDWLLGDEVPEATKPDVPDWQSDLRSAAGMPDWLQEAAPEADFPSDEMLDFPSDMPDMEDESGGEDWFADLGQRATSEAGASIPDINSADFLNMFGEEEPEEDVPDILREIGLAPPRPAATPPPAEPIVNDFSSLLDEGGEEWFAESEAEEEPAEPVNELPDWLTQIEEADLQAEDSGDDFFAEMSDFDEPAQPARTPLQDIDSLLAGYDSVETSLPDTDERLLDLNPDIERLLAEDTFDDEDEFAPADLPEGLVAELPDWLSEVGASVDELSAAALLRKSQKDRPIEELNDRLQALHEGGLNLGEGEDPALSPAFKSLLPGVNDAIPPAPVVRAADAGIAGDLILTDAQRDKVNRLKGMVAAGQAQGEDPSRMTAIDRTLDSPFMRDVLEEEPDLLAVTPEPELAAPVRARTRPRLKVGRLVVTLLVAAAVILPFFVSALRIGDLPPDTFDVNSAAFRAFQQVDQIRVGDYVLVAAEYGPTAAAELDGLTDALLRHIIERGARPVIVSGNAVGLLHASNLLTSIAQTQTVPLVANQDYYVTRYLAAGVIGTRAFVSNVASLVAYDLTGQPTNLPLTTLNDFGLMVVVAERAEDVRAWAEQVTPYAGNVPLVAAVSFAAAPLAEPYVIPASGSALTGLSGLLVGFKDAYTYREMLDSSGRPAQIIPPTATTPAPTAVPLVEVTPEATEPLETATPLPPTEIPTETLIPSVTPTLPTATPSMTPTETLTPSPTPTETPLFPASFTPTPSDTPDPANAPGITGVINTGDGVNVRQGPGRSFPVVTQLPGRSTVQIIGRDGGGEWYNILMEDGTEGWISASLVTIQEPTPASSGKRLPTWRLVQAETPTPEGFVPQATAEVTSEVTAESTPEATAEVSTPQPPAIVKGDKTTALPVTMAYRDERWYGMTLGIIVIVGVIMLGAIINILRSLLTRKGRS